MPLEVLLNTMRQFWHEGDHKSACEIARDAAPYCHARISSTTLKSDPASPVGIIVIPGKARDADGGEQ